MVWICDPYKILCHGYPFSYNKLWITTTIIGNFGWEDFRQGMCGALPVLVGNNRAYRCLVR